MPYTEEKVQADNNNSQKEHMFTGSSGNGGTSSTRALVADQTKGQWSGRFGRKQQHWQARGRLDLPYKERKQVQ